MYVSCLSLVLGGGVVIGSPRVWRCVLGAHALLLFLFVSVVPSQSGSVVSAQSADPCTEALLDLPQELLGNDPDSQITYGTATGLVSGGAVLAPTAGGTAVTAGSSIAGGSVAVAGAQIVGAAILGAAAGCFFVDVLNADHYAASAICSVGWLAGVFGVGSACSTEPSPSAAVGGSDVTASTPTAIGTTDSTSTTTGCWSTSIIPCRKRTYTFPTVPSRTSRTVPAVIPPGSQLQRGGVVLGDASSSRAEYALPWNRSYVCTMGGCSFTSFSEPAVMYLPAAGSTTMAGRTSLAWGVKCGGPLDTDGNGSAETTVQDPGSVCGVPPGTILAFVTPSGTGADGQLPALVTSLWPEANQGWQRRYITDAFCVNSSTLVGVWRRYTGASFWDRSTTVQRPSVARCQAGEVPHRTLITKVPVNVTCASGVVCWPNSTVADVAMPDEWITVGTVPDWLSCLSVGATCGSPALDDNATPEPEDDVCEWGSATVELTYCTSQVSPLTSALDVVPKTQQTRTLTTQPAAGVAASTGLTVPALGALSDAPGPTPPPGTSVGIDIGSGGQPSCTGALAEAYDTLLAEGLTPEAATAALGCVPLQGGDGDCWPNGWGWFNPGQWVLRPIKCAVEWALVPEDGYTQAWLTDQREALETVPPFNFAVLLVDFGADLIETVREPEAGGCVTMQVVVGVNAIEPDFCAEALPLSAGQRSTVVTLLTVPVYLGVMAHAFSLLSPKPAAGPEQLTLF